MNIYKSLKQVGGFVSLCAAMSFVASCTDDIEVGDSFVDASPSGTVSSDTIFGNAEYTKQFLTGIYGMQYYGLPYSNKDFIPHSHNHYTGKLDAVTDLYQLHWASTQVYNDYYLGALSANNSALISFTNDGVWEAVRAVNLLLANIDDVPGLSDELKARYSAEAKCLMAARYFDLLPMYGGLPLIKQAFTGGETSYDIPRATIEETVDYLVQLLDEAIPHLPWAWNGNTSETNDTQVGRWTAAGAMALKAKILTFAASPIFNSEAPYYDGSSEAEQQKVVWYGNYDVARWQRALKACEEFFARVESDGHYALKQANGTTSNDYRLAYRLGYLYQGSTEILHQTRVRDYDNWNNGYYAWSNWVNLGRNSYCATFEYMSMFPWNDGKYFDWKKDSVAIFGRGRNLNNARLFYLYPDATSKVPYRDPRLYENMIVNGQDETMDMASGTTSGNEYELWVGGEHVGESVLKEQMVTKFPTGFGVMKYHCGSEYQRYPLQWCYLSLSEMYLFYAECLAQTGNLTKANQQVDIVRARVGLGTLVSGCNPEHDVMNDKDAFIEELLRERACELGMTNARYHDMVRYKRTDWMTKPLHGLLVYRLVQDAATGTWLDNNKPFIGDEKNAGGTHPTKFRYEKFQLRQPEQRALWRYEEDPNNLAVRKWLLAPLPATEINKNYGLVQNPGW